MKALINKVKDQIIPQKPNIAQVVKEALKKTEFDFNDNSDLESIISLLTKETLSRTQIDIDKIRLAFFRFKFFQELEKQMGPEIVTNLYKQLSYEVAQERQTIFHLGDIGRKFYIILRGSVWVLIKQKGLQDGQEEQPLKDENVKSKKKRKTTFARLTKQQSKPLVKQQTFNLDDRLKSLTEQEFIETVHPGFIKVGMMKSGDSFGEIALTKQMPRTATIVASEETHFATVTREQFNKLLSAYYEFVQSLNVTFLQNIFVFKDWNEQMLNQLYYHFNFEEKYHFSIIYKEGEIADKIYLIKEGEIEVSQLVRSFLPNQTTSYFNKTQTKNQRVRLTLLGQGSIFGHEELLKDQNHRITQAQCQSEKCVLFVLDKARFLQYFQRNNALDRIKTYEKVRDPLANQQVEVIQDIQTLSTKPIIEPRDIPIIEEKDILKDYTLKKPQVSVPRIASDKQTYGYQKLQGLGHLSKAHYNFQKNQDVIQKNRKNTEPLLMGQALFEMDSTKGSAISIMNRCFPGAMRQKYEIPDCSMSKKLLIQSLKLPKLLTQVEFTKDPNSKHTTSFSTFTYQPRIIQQDEESDDSQLIY